jgi:hypothetical protein
MISIGVLGFIVWAQDGSLSWQHESSITSLYAGKALELEVRSFNETIFQIGQSAGSHAIVEKQ